MNENLRKTKIFIFILSNCKRPPQETHKTELTWSLSCCLFHAFSNFGKFYHEKETLKSNLFDNSYHHGFVDKNV